jgi:predicted secreted hydrolase
MYTLPRIKKVWPLLLITIALSIIVHLYVESSKWSGNVPSNENDYPNTMTEWWYMNAHVENEQGERFGVMSWLRNSGFTMGIIVDKNRERYYYAANVSSYFPIQNQAVQWIWNKSTSYNIHCNLPLVEFSLGFVSNKKPVMRDNPFNSHTYYLTNMNASGSLVIDGDSTEVKGKALVGHSWNNHTEPFYMFEWFIMHLDNNVEIMLTTLFIEGKPTYRIGQVIEHSGIPRKINHFSVQRQEYWIDQLGRKWNDRWIIRTSDSTITRIEVEADFRERYVPYHFRETTGRAKVIYSGEEIIGDVVISMSEIPIEVTDSNEFTKKD